MAASRTKKTRPAKRDEFVYRFWDGERERAVDVWAVSIKLSGRLSELQSALSQAEAGELSNVEKTVEFMRNILNIKEFSCDDNGVETGLTVNEVMEIVYDLFELVDGQKKSTNNEQT